MIQLAGFALIGSSLFANAQAQERLTTGSFEFLVERAKATCILNAAQECVGLLWAYADTSGDGLISVEESENFLNVMKRWNSTNTEKLRTRATISMGLATAKVISVDYVIERYDVDGDKMLSPEEALADLRFDQRPLGDLLVDEDAVDRDGLSERFGLAGPVVYRLLRFTGTQLRATGAD